jgi:multidrug resistance efflux pump
MTEASVKARRSAMTAPFGIARVGIWALRCATTVLVLGCAAGAAAWMWNRYQLEPWTRDGRLRADVVAVAPDVSGFVTRVWVRDNQLVHRGDVLFELDQAHFKLALRQAEAAIESDRAALLEARREAGRDDSVADLVPVELRQQSHAKVDQLQAALDQALVARDTAALNLQRSTVRALVDGRVVNLELRPGDYLTAGREGLALIDSDSLYIDGYFEETKLPRIHIGDAAVVRLMGEPRLLRGHVDSIAFAIEDRERTQSANLVANVNPTFSWVRLAQRIPVRVRLDEVAPGVMLIAGRTATVVIQPVGSARRQASSGGMPL